jgi:hypothetical protein
VGIDLYDLSRDYARPGDDDASLRHAEERAVLFEPSEDDAADIAANADAPGHLL